MIEPGSSFSRGSPLGATERRLSLLPGQEKRVDQS